MSAVSQVKRDLGVDRSMLATAFGIYLELCQARSYPYVKSGSGDHECPQLMLGKQVIQAKTHDVIASHFFSFKINSLGAPSVFIIVTSAATTCE